MSEEAIDELIAEIFKEMNPNGLKDMDFLLDFPFLQQSFPK